MKIITWNIRQGGGTRVTEIITRLIAHKADLIVITEYRNNENGAAIRKALLDEGYLSQYCPIVDKNKNTLLIASKENFYYKLFSQQLKDDIHRTAKAECEKFNLYGMYFPQKLEKKKIFEFMLNQITNSTGKPMIFIGDFNTGKPYIDEDNNTFSCSEYMGMIEQHSFIDTWRYINEDKKDYTWYSNAGNGFRIDHVFMSDILKDRVKDCYYSHYERESKISDHSLMVLVINV